VESSRRAIEAWERMRHERRVSAWRDAEVIDADLARRLTIEQEKKEATPQSEPRPHAIERSAEVVLGGATTFFREISTRYGRVVASIETDKRREELPAPPIDEPAVDASRAIFGDNAVVGAGVEALGALDDDLADEEKKPLGALQVFWFIGTILVLAGSLMGVREAWRSLEGVFRPLSIAGALFAYHVLFAGLARGLVKRSAVTGRVLGVIATGLLPVVFVAAAVAVGMSTRIAIPVALVLLAGSAATLRMLGTSVFRGGVGAAIAMGIVPCLVLELPLAPGTQTVTWIRLAMPLVALVPLAIASIRARASATPAALAHAAAAIYGAVGVAIFATSGGPSDVTLDLGTFGAAQLASTLWIGAFAGCAWWPLSEGGLARTIPRLATPLVVLALALLVGASITATIASLSIEPATLKDAGILAWAPPIVVAGTVAALAVEAFARGRPLALHVAVPFAHLAVLLGARTALSGAFPRTWSAATVGVGAALFIASPYANGRGRRFAVPIWGAIGGFATLLATLVLDGLDSFSNRPLVTTSIAAAGLCVSAHAGGRTKRPLLHVVGALAAFIGAAAFLGPVRTESFAWTASAIMAGLAFAYGAAALVVPATEVKALDDISLGFAGGGALLGALAIPPAVTFATTGDDPKLVLLAASPIIAAAVALALRAWRDASVLVSLAAGLAFAASAHVVMGVSTFAQGALVAGVCAVALVAPAALRREAADAPRFGRAIFGVVPLPLGARGRTVLDGYGLAAALLAGLAFARGFMWIAARGAVTDPFDPSAIALESERILVVVGAIAIVAAALIAFATHALDRVLARGHVATLAAAGLAIALAAVANRIGRPLPPDVVGFRLTFILAGVWLVSRAFVRWGPAVAKKLERESQGSFYHFVPHAGVAALSLLLLVDAFLVGSPTLGRALVVTPPLLLFGGALGALLLHRSFGLTPLLHVALAALLAFACVVGVHHAVIGPAFQPLVPGTRWALASDADVLARGLDPRFFPLPFASVTDVPRRALEGTAAFVVACALVFGASARVPFVLRTLGLGRPPSEHPGIARAFAHWTTIAAVLIALALSFQPSVLPALVLCFAGALAIARGSAESHLEGPKHRLIALVLGAPLVVHALAHLPGVSTYPEWAGPALGGLAVSATAIGAVLSHRRNHDGSILVRTQLAAIAYGVLALAYAFAVAARSAPDPTNALYQTFTDAFANGDATLVRSFAPAQTLALLALAAAIAAWSWRGDASRILSVAPPLLLASAGVAAGSAAVIGSRLDLPGKLITREGAIAAAAISAAATISHVASIIARRARRDDVASGIVVGRDIALLASSVVMALFVLLRDPGGVSSGVFGIGALGLSIAISLDACVRERTARHVYLVEVLVLALYAFATRELRPRPEVDALLGLGYGFTLLGVAVIARRNDLPTVATATRRFLVALPVLVAALTTNGATDSAAAIALGSALLYGAVAFAESSRIFGSLAALAANVALLVFALAQGLDGVEIYIGPLGLLVAMLSQIFAPKMTPHARSFLRVVAGALLYLPSGLKLTLRLGAAEDATYSVVFGAVCLLGVVCGLVLRVRAYLALGTIFLTLDVIANLVYVGLRDHRIGFVLLSASGLLILGVMILVTLRRDAARAILTRLRVRLRAWD
jgi:hypothetical protein